MEQDKLWDIAQNDEKHRLAMFPDARYRHVLRFLSRGTTALNIGVGSGHFEKFARDAGVDIFALDPSERTIALLRDSLGLGEKARAGYVQAIPFADGLFDSVVMSEVLEHLEDDVLEAGLREVMRVLAPAGALVVTTPYNERLEDSVVICPRCGFSFHRWGHVQSFDKERMAGLLRTAGFAIEKLYVGTFVDWTRPGLAAFCKGVVRSALARLGQPIADPRLIVVARKPGPPRPAP